MNLCLYSNVKSAIALMWRNGYIHRQGSGNLDEHSNAFYIGINSPSQLKKSAGGEREVEGRRMQIDISAARIELHGRIKRNIRIMVFLVK